MIKYRILSILFGSIFIYSCAVFSGETLKYSPDGRMGTRCLPSRLVDGLDEECRVQLGQLVITPEKFHAKGVRARGVLIVENEAIGISDGVYKIWLEIEAVDDGLALLKSKQVTVVGVYDALSFGHFDMWDGTISVLRIKE